MTVDVFFELEAKKGLERRFVLFEQSASTQLQEKRARYGTRLDMEINVIQKMGFAGYFFIVADFIRWAKNKIFLWVLVVGRALDL